jgi:hypothetical protein
MDAAVIHRLLDVIDEVVRAKGSWTEKRAAILSSPECDRSDIVNLEEFAEWFASE